MSKLMLSVLLSALFAVTGSSIAEQANTKQRQEMQSLRMEKAKIHEQERLLRLKHKLNLEQNQMQAWDAYAAHVEANAGKKMRMVKELRQKTSDKGKLPSSLDLAEANIKRLESQLASAKQRLVIFSDLYQVLDDEQRATIDKLTHRKVRTKAREAREKRMQKNRDN